jgi:hypothetical protein
MATTGVQHGEKTSPIAMPASIAEPAETLRACQCEQDSFTARARKPKHKKQTASPIYTSCENTIKVPINVAAVAKAP